MTRVLVIFIILCASLCLHAADGKPPAPKTLGIGIAAPDFKLPGVDGRDYTLASFKDAKLLCVIFTCNHCPTAQAYEERIKKLYADYKDRGVALVAISPNDDLAVRLDELGYTDVNDSFDDMKYRAKTAGFAFPYLYDGATQATSLAYGVVATPQVFLFDAERKLRYVGRIDDSDVKEVTSHDTRNAIDELLAGKPVSVEKTRTFGCSTKWSDKRKDAVASLAKWDAEPVELKTLDEEALAKLLKNDEGKFLLINVWATWCAPCKAELPEFLTMHRMYRHRDLQVITISIDDPDEQTAAIKVLQDKKMSTTNYISKLPTQDKLAEILDKEWQGPLPYTVLIGPGGKVLYRKQNSIDPLEVRTEIVNVLGRTYANRAKKK